MAVKIRLSRYGKHKAPFYRVVVTDGRMKRDGRNIERIGTLNPLVEPAALKLDPDRVRYWLGVGAQPSDTVSQLIERTLPGFLGEIEKRRLDKLRASRAKRKARGASKPAKTTTKAKGTKKGSAAAAS